MGKVFSLYFHCVSVQSQKQKFILGRTAKEAWLQHLKYISYKAADENQTLLSYHAFFSTIAD